MKCRSLGTTLCRAAQTKQHNGEWWMRKEITELWIFNQGTVLDHDEQNLISGNTRTVLEKFLFTTSSRITVHSLLAPLPKNYIMLITMLIITVTLVISPSAHGTRQTGENPGWKCNRWACARFCSKWQVSTPNPESIHTVHLSTTHYLKYLMFSACV
jgi:hypothetical protein